MPILAKNKRAKFDYEILDKYEAGIILSGQEVKSAKNGHISLKGAYVSVRDNELYLINAHISPYKYAGRLPDYVPTRPRKLLLRKKEINRLLSKIQEKGLTLLPISLYTKSNLVKIEVGVGRGKKLHDKRETIKKREINRDLKRIQKLYR